MLIRKRAFEIEEDGLFPATFAEMGEGEVESRSGVELERAEGSGEGILRGILGIFGDGIVEFSRETREPGEAISGDGGAVGQGGSDGAGDRFIGTEEEVEVGVESAEGIEVVDLRGEEGEEGEEGNGFFDRGWAEVNSVVGLGRWCFEEGVVEGEREVIEDEVTFDVEGVAFVGEFGLGKGESVLGGF